MNTSRARTTQHEKAVLVGLSLGWRGRARTLASVEELALLAESAGARVVSTVVQERARRDPATLIGRGKVAEIAAACEESSADVVVFDDELTPAQQRNVEQAVGRKTLDRTQLILDIFARRARTREGRLQVELAQLDYLLPRLAGKGILLSRLGGGIGTRGPGETKLETDRRRIRQRIQAIRREIEHVRRERHVRREARTRRETPVVALVGYTNAGKSTLFNALTQGDGGRLEPALHDARPARAQGAAGRRPGVPAGRHGRLHPQAAAPAGGGVPGDARGGEGGGPAAARRGRIGARRRRARGGGARRAAGDRRRRAAAAARAEQGRPRRLRAAQRLSPTRATTPSRCRR